MSKLAGDKNRSFFCFLLTSESTHRTKCVEVRRTTDGAVTRSTGVRGKAADDQLPPCLTHLNGEAVASNQTPEETTVSGLRENMLIPPTAVLSLNAASLYGL